MHACVGDETSSSFTSSNKISVAIKWGLFVCISFGFTHVSMAPMPHELPSAGGCRIMTLACKEVFSESVQCKYVT
jgi:hypothetical protein